jgi:hypothetical protein
LIKTLFERAGYRVTRLGVEELFVEIIHLDEEQYKSLNLPLALRYLPDLLIADHDLNRAFLLEVKFRKDFNEFSIKHLYHELKKQRQYWPDSYAVILIANPFVEGGRFHQDYIRIVPPNKTETLNPLGTKDPKQLERIKHALEQLGCEFVWGCLPKLNDTFSKFCHKTGIFQNADIITTTIRDLKKL